MTRNRLPETRMSMTRKVVVAKLEVYVIVGFYDDGSPGEIFVRVGKCGSFVRGCIDAACVAASVALQHGAPWDSITGKWRGSNFEPKDENASSVMDAVARAADSLISTAGGVAAGEKVETP